MRVDKNLFPYDLVIVSIMKNAAPYIEEWLDYHLIAGVNHFFIYDNDSEDNFVEKLQPYIDAELVTYIFYPGKSRQIAAYNDAIQNFKYFCRYMAFVDDDEFILPKNNRSISEVVDELFAIDSRIAGVEIPWVLYGSSGLKKVDYTKGVLERFVYREADLSKIVKTIINPRKVKYMWTPHFATYFDGFSSLNQGNIEANPNLIFNFEDKIVVNHYHTKSLEEYMLKRARGDVIALNGEKYIESTFKAHDKNEVFDDSILKYRDARLSTIRGGGFLSSGKVTKLNLADC